MEIQNLDNDNVLRIWVSVYTISGIAIKATFVIWDTPPVMFVRTNFDCTVKLRHIARLVKIMLYPKVFFIAYM